MVRRNTGKKIVIRQYAKPPQLPDNYYEDTSQSVLKESLHVLDAPERFRLQHAYTAITSLVRNGNGARLYKDVIQIFDTAAQRILKESNDLRVVAQQYQTYIHYILLMKHICLQLDSQYMWDAKLNIAVKSTFGKNTTQSLYTVGLHVFARHLKQFQTAVYQNWRTVFLNDWNSGDDRQDDSALQDIWYMWGELPNVLDEDVLQHDLEAYWRDHSIPKIPFVYDIFQRCHRYEWLNSPWLQHIVDTQLYQPQATTLSDDVCELLLRNGIEPMLQRDDTSILYKWWILHTRHDAADANLRLQNYAKTAATNLPIAELLVFQDHFAAILKKLPNQVVPLKSIYESVVTEETAETLAKYMDGILKSTKKLDLQNPDWLDKVITGVFVPLSSKDVFEAFYKKDLAKRLLWNRVVSMDVEKQVCSLLKSECGAGYTSKLEGMFQDIENSRETMMVYQQMPSDLSFEVQVLTTGYWPLYPEYSNLILPDTLQEHQTHFCEFYKSKYQGRRVAWKYALGHCVIKTQGFNKAYELVLSLCQATVLLQFDGSTRTLPELLKLTGLEDRDEMERILQSLSLGKDGTRILRKMDFGTTAKPRKSVSDQDTFCINESFSNNALRIRITNVLTKETKQERDTTVAAISRDRLNFIDAAIVRILKSRKSLLHQELIPQLMEHLKFPAKVTDIKKRIESLIEREYVERDASDRNRYNYLA